ncbi:hypothetical protein MBOURGENBZM_22760 [Methanoculleus bourgensis]|nr:hypothetical protein MBOURGENBZM_22760 [Methanoculleus bourgensis]
MPEGKAAPAADKEVGPFYEERYADNEYDDGQYHGDASGVLVPVWRESHNTFPRSGLKKMWRAPKSISPSPSKINRIPVPA